MAAGGAVLPLLFAALTLTTVPALASDADVLLQFKSTVSGADAALPNWVAGNSPCVAGGWRSNWTGVLCDGGGNVYGLQLEGMSLAGTLDVGPLSELQGLRALSFKNNALEGLMPSINKLGALKTVYLSGNRFSGEIAADAFAGMGSVKKVHLSSNGFSGPIPASLAGLERLLELRLDGNRFTGEIPELRQPDLKLVNVSGNDLQGPIPESLRDMDASMFEGNKLLCGPPLGSAPCSPTTATSTTTTTPAPSQTESPDSSSNISIPLLVVIIVLLLIAIALIIAGLAYARRRRGGGGEVEQLRQPLSSKVEHFDAEQQAAIVAPSTAVASAAASVPSPAGKSNKVQKEMEHGRLTFIAGESGAGGRRRFEMQDLLKASAEVLGSGDFGSSYKALLLQGPPAVVVKRFREMNGVGREDFQEHMRRLGRLSHPNLLPLVAYYYRREEKLLITEHVAAGSLARLLYGRHDRHLDWAARLRIVSGVCRGLAYLAEELPMLALPCGHLKSSNVLVGDTGEALLTDYALSPVMNKSHASRVMVSYKSPECLRGGGKPTPKSDVWSFGILVMEILTGKYPGAAGADDLAGWVDSVVASAGADGGAGASRMFDSEMTKAAGEKEEVMEILRKLMRVGIGCCEREVEKRWELGVAREKIEELMVEAAAAAGSTVAAVATGGSALVVAGDER